MLPSNTLRLELLVRARKVRFWKVLLLRVDKDGMVRLQSIGADMLLFVNDSTVLGRFTVVRAGK